MSSMERFTGAGGPRIIGPGDGKDVDLGSSGTRFMVGGFSLVEHPIAPRHLAVPVHMHTREDEYNYVLEGRLRAILSDDIVFAEPGDLVFKPRDQWHTFWNAGEETCRILEVITPAGFEHYFVQLDEAAETPGNLAELYGISTDPAATNRIRDKYDLIYTSR